MSDWGLLWVEIEDPATVTLTNPRTQSTIIVENVLLRQTEQQDLITGNENIDGFWLVAHLWTDNLSGVIPLEGMFINDGTHNYEIREVSHDSRRQRYRCLLLRRRT